MKKLLVILSFSLSFPLFAQEYDLDWGVENKIKSSKLGNILEDLVGEVDDGFYVLRTKFKGVLLMGIPIINYDFYILKYSKLDFALQWGHTVFPKNYFENSKRPTQYMGVEKVGNNLQLLFANFDKSANQYVAASQPLDSEGNPDGDYNELSVVEAKKKSTAGTFSYIFSPDKSKVLVFYTPSFSKKANESFNFVLYDKNFEKIASRKVVLPIQDKDFTIMDVGVANDDEVYVLAKIYEGKVEKNKKKIRSYSFKIFYFPMESEVEDQGGSDGDDGSGTDDVTEYELSLSEKYANSLSFKLTDQHLICSGFYGNKSSDDISGIFYMRINRETGEEEANDYYAFSKEFIAEFYPEKKAEKADKKGVALDIPEIVLRDLILREDGGLTLVGEQHYVQEHCYVDSKGNMRCTYWYHYNDIIVASINSEGKIEWTTKIPKKSYTINIDHPALGYAMAVQGDKLHFFFNDHPENLKIKDAKKVKVLTGFKKSIVAAVMLDEQGRMTKKELFKNADKKLFLYPQTYYQPSKDEIILYNGTKGKERFLRVSIKDSKGKKRK